MFSVNRGEGESPWTQTFVAMSSSTNPATVALIDTVLRDMGTADFPLSLQVRHSIRCKTPFYRYMPALTGISFKDY